MRMGEGGTITTTELLGKATHEGDFVILSRPLHFKKLTKGRVSMQSYQSKWFS